MSALMELTRLKAPKAKTAKERAQRRKENGRDNKAAYLFLLPWFIGLIVITIGPMIASLYLSFTNYNLLQSP
jgi:multiple sugar transport system permease protein